MNQMNISITDHLEEYVQAKVKSGSYNNASEVVREALRRMEDGDLRALQMAGPTIEEVLAGMTPSETETIRKTVLESIAEIERGEYTEYEGREGLDRLFDGIKARGRRRLQTAANE